MNLVIAGRLSLPATAAVRLFPDRHVTDREAYIGLQFSVRMFVVPPLGGKAQEPDDSG